MRDQSPQPPAGLLDAIRQAANEILPGRLGSMREGFVAAEGEQASGEPTFGAPRPLYSLGLDRIVDGSGLAGADLVGWRTLVNVGSRSVAIVDSDAATDAPTVTSFNYGPFVAGLARAGDAAKVAEGEPPDGANGRDAGPLDERVLQVPALYFVALWLHDASEPGRDLIVPADPAPPGLTADERYPAAEVVSQLLRLATATSATDDHGKT